MNSERDFAGPVIATIKALDSEERRRILIELEEAGSLSYSEILLRTGFDKGTLNYHLKKLVASGMIRNFLQEQQVTPYFSYYEVSELGRNLIEGLLDAFRPPGVHIRMVAATCDIRLSPEIPRKEWIETQDAANASLSEVIAAGKQGRIRL